MEIDVSLRLLTPRVGGGATQRNLTLDLMVIGTVDRLVEYRGLSMDEAVAMVEETMKMTMEDWFSLAKDPRGNTYPYRLTNYENHPWVKP